MLTPEAVPSFLFINKPRRPFQLPSNDVNFMCSGKSSPGSGTSHKEGPSTRSPVPGPCAGVGAPKREKEAIGKTKFTTRVRRELSWVVLKVQCGRDNLLQAVGRHGASSQHRRHQEGHPHRGALPPARTRLLALPLRRPELLRLGAAVEEEAAGPAESEHGWRLGILVPASFVATPVGHQVRTGVLTDPLPALPDN